MFEKLFFIVKLFNLNKQVEYFDKFNFLLPSNKASEYNDVNKLQKCVEKLNYNTARSQALLAIICSSSRIWKSQQHLYFRLLRKVPFIKTSILLIREPKTDRK